jgi:hypothetical protein
MKKIYLPLLLITLALSCTRQLTEPKIFSLSGNVTVHGQTDFAGITVALYKATEPDTALQRLLTAYPSVGQDLSRDISFDHRLADADFSTTTNIDGQFMFSDIPDGQYNLVAQKTGYGWSYLLNIDGATELPDIKLYPEVPVSGVISTYNSSQRRRGRSGVVHR